MSKRLFGTDGVRGVANAKLTPELAFDLGQAAGLYLARTGTLRKAVIGQDTRISSTMLSAAVSAGLCSAGVSVYDLGVAPTPTISYVARTGSYGLGVIVSASHNPAPDNGIKFVGHDGKKLADETEVEIEGLIKISFDRPTGGEIGRIVHGREGVESYLGMLEAIVPGGLDGWKIALDAAHGAAFELGPEILRRLGAELVAIGTAPDGININSEGGATKPHTICELTKSSGATVGVAFDGDADRAIFSDSQGRLINGDRTMGVWADHMQAIGALDPSLIVGTVMSNGGFVHYLASRGIEVERAPVGDKYVAQRIDATRALVGGEQSGHIIFPHHGPTGDGLVTMLEFFRVLKALDRTSAECYESYDPWPQLLVNMAVDSTAGWQEKLAGVLNDGKARLQDRGRIVVRPSGTQPVIRVMVEADEYALRDEIADAIVAEVSARMGGHVEGRVDLTHALGD